MGFLCDRGIVGLGYITGGDSLEGNSSREVGGSLSPLEWLWEFPRENPSRTKSRRGGTSRGAYHALPWSSWALLCSDGALPGLS